MAQRREDGSVDLVFNHHNIDSSVEFSADAWAAIWKAAIKLDAGEGDRKQDRMTVRNPLHNTDGKGTLKIDYLSISTDDQPIRFGVENSQDVDLANDLPMISMKTPGDNFGIELTLRPRAARELHDWLDKALEAHSAIRALAKSRTVPAFSR